MSLLNNETFVFKVAASMAATLPSAGGNGLQEADAKVETVVAGLAGGMIAAHHDVYDSVE